MPQFNLKYKRWQGLVSQSGTSAPTAVVLVNELDDDLVFSYFDQGVYLATLSAAFPEGLTHSPNSATVVWSLGQDEAFVLGAARYTSDSVAITSGTLANSAQDGYLYSTYVEIRVYDN